MEKWASTNPLLVKHLITIQDGGIESLIYPAFRSKITPALQARVHPACRAFPLLARERLYQESSKIFIEYALHVARMQSRTQA